MLGWVKLHRQFTQWEWYTDANTMRVFMHLLITANHKPGHRFRGIEMRPGQCITGLHKLAKDLKLTVQQVRTALNHLKKSGEITTKATNQFSVVTLINWAKYQTEAEQPTSQPTNHQQTSNKRATTFKNVKNVNNENKEAAHPNWLQWMLETQTFQEKTILAVMHYKRLTFVELTDYINLFGATQIAKGKQYTNTNEARAHFVSWLQYQLQNNTVAVETNVKRPSSRKL